MDDGNRFFGPGEHGFGQRAEAVETLEPQIDPGHERSLVDEWRRLLPGGESASVRREIRRRQKMERRLKARGRRREQWLARRRRRELAKIERQLVGRRAGLPSMRLPFIGREPKATDVTAEFEAKINSAVEAALRRHRDELLTEFQRSMEARLRLAVEAMERRVGESERRIADDTQRSITAAKEQDRKVINRVSSDMWRSMDRRLSRETERIQKEVERSIGVEMSRMYLRLSRSAEEDVLRGRRR